MVDEHIKQRQSDVQKTGEDWEDEVINLIAPKLNRYRLNVVKSKEKAVQARFWKQLHIPTKRAGVWGDIDLIVFNGRSEVIAVISCKVSLHGRFTESLFYWLLFRKVLNKSFAFFFATNDKGRGQSEWRSEWGTDDNPTKDRELAESYTDGVYVKNPKTSLGGIVKDFDKLIDDILIWSQKLG